MKPTIPTDGHTPTREIPAVGRQRALVSRALDPIINAPPANGFTMGLMNVLVGLATWADAYHATHHRDLSEGMAVAPCWATCVRNVRGLDAGFEIRQLCNAMLRLEGFDHDA